MPQRWDTSVLGTTANSMIFRNEKQFAVWFRANLKEFGFEKTLIEWKGKYQLTTPDAWCLPIGWRDTPMYPVTRVELEHLGHHFRKHEHDPADCDAVYCAEDNRVLYGDGDDRGLTWLEVGFACDPTAHERCAAHARRILAYYDSGRRDRAARAGQLLAWFQPEGAGACVVCAMAFSEHTEAGVVNWHREALYHLDCLPSVIARTRDYVIDKEKKALAAEARYEKRRKR